MKQLILLLWLAFTLSSIGEPPPTPAQAAGVRAWWNKHIKGFRPDRSRRWDPRGVVRDMPDLVEEARLRPIPRLDLLPPIETRLPEVPPTKPAPLPTPGGWP